MMFGFRNKAEAASGLFHMPQFPCTYYSSTLTAWTLPVFLMQIYVYIFIQICISQGAVIKNLWIFFSVLAALL